MAGSGSLKIQLSDRVKLETWLKQENFDFKQADHSFWRAQKEGITITLYKSGKLLMQGKNADLFLDKISQLISSQETSGTQNLPAEKTQFKHKTWIGTDESGKGDYFGPLVVAGVMAEEDNIKKLYELGVQDSKKINDTKIRQIAPKIREICIFSVITINPQKYNELYKKIGNLNNLLAWGHARAIENILEKKPCQNALSDKFGNETLIKNALLKNGKKINLEQRTKAEDDIAVAAASILARFEFLRRLKLMSDDYGISFSKGASQEVISQAKKFVDRYGKDKLSEIAKLHFKTTEKIY